MVFSHIRKQESGHVIFISMIMVLVSLGFTLGYLQFVMGERFIHLRHVAQVQANLNAIAGLGKIGNPFLLSPYFTTDTTLAGEDIPTMNGFSDSIRCIFVAIGNGNQPQLESNAKGVAHFNGFDGEPIDVVDRVKVRYNPDTFAIYMYFTNAEDPAPPWAGSYVSFGSGETLEGIVHSNDDITMSSFGCPEFVEGPNEQISHVTTSGNFIMNGCSESIFTGTHADSAKKIDWPPFSGQERVKDAANWIIHGDDLITLAGPEPDMLLMTEIEFFPGGFYIRQWPYSVPPYVYQSPFSPDYAAFADSAKQYYPYTYSHYPMFFPGGVGSFGTPQENPHNWYHYDFPDYPKPPDNDLYYYREIIANEGVIWVEGGQVRVFGDVRGRYTIATSAPTPYRMRWNPNIVDYMKNNIWIIDDIRYADSFANGAVREGSSNRLGLLSAANVIVANTRANGARNQAWSSDGIVINAAMIAMDEAFQVQYWQNTTNDFNFMNGGAIKGDGQGQGYYGNSTNDYRGTVNIWGSVIQAKRGYLKRNDPGPYTRTIGYDKNYNYDYNMREYPPPAWPENRNDDGSRNLTVAEFGEY